jgi:hypothetical protein
MSWPGWAAGPSADASARRPYLELWMRRPRSESDATIPRHGIIALQIHGGANNKVQYRNLIIKKLPEGK